MLFALICSKTLSVRCLRGRSWRLARTNLSKSIDNLRSCWARWTSRASSPSLLLWNKSMHTIFELFVGSAVLNGWSVRQLTELSSLEKPITFLRWGITRWRGGSRKVWRRFRAHRKEAFMREARTDVFRCGVSRGLRFCPMIIRWSRWASRGSVGRETPNILRWWYRRSIYSAWRTWLRVRKRSSCKNWQRLRQNSITSLPKMKNTISCNDSVEISSLSISNRARRWQRKAESTIFYIFRKCLQIREESRIKILRN